MANKVKTILTVTTENEVVKRNVDLIFRDVTGFLATKKVEYQLTSYEVVEEIPEVDETTRSES